MDTLIPMEVRIVLYEKTSVSGSGKYKFIVEQCRVKFTNIVITRGIIILASKPKEYLIELDIQQDPKDFWHCWVEALDHKEYLIGKAHDKGALLVSLGSGKVFDLVTDYSWRSACVSPGGDKLAVACSKESKKPIRIFDFRNVENPPYLELRLSPLPDVDKSEPYDSDIEWSDNTTLKVSLPVHRKDKLAFGYDYYTEDVLLKVKPPEDISRQTESRASIAPSRHYEPPQHKRDWEVNASRN